MPNPDTLDTHVSGLKRKQRFGPFFHPSLNGVIGKMLINFAEEHANFGYCDMREYFGNSKVTSFHLSCFMIWRNIEDDNLSTFIETKILKLPCNFSTEKLGIFINSGQTKISRIFCVHRTCHYSDGGSLVFIRVQLKNDDIFNIIDCAYRERNGLLTDCSYELYMAFPFL